jgi:hemerythrin
MDRIDVSTEKLELGDIQIDREHHLQVALVSALAEAIERNRPLLAKRLLDQLAGFTAAHFRGEELLMERVGYDQLPIHRQEHQSLLAHIEEVRYLLGNAENDLALPMAVDLRSGFSSHIASQDREFCERARAPLGGR